MTDDGEFPCVGLLLFALGSFFDQADFS